MLNRIISGLCLVILSANMGSGTIKMSGSKEYKAVELSPYIYNQVQSDLRDILIMDNENNNIPYFVHSFENSEDFETKYYQPVLFYSFNKDKDSSFDFYMKPNNLEDIKVTSIKFDIEQSYFAKNIDIFGSFDGDNWTYIKNDRIYAVEENSNLEIFFEGAEKYTYYRITLYDNIEQININGITLIYSETFVNKNYFLKDLIPEFEVIEEDRETIIRIYGTKNLKIHEVAISTESNFKREVRWKNISKVLYNLQLGDSFYNDTVITLDSHSDNDYIDIRILNGDDNPIEIDGITLSYFYDLIIFKGETGKEYRIVFGDKDIETPPAYDIENYKELILKEGYDILGIENITESIQEEIAPEKDYKLLFNIIFISVSVILAFIIIKKLVS